MNTMPNSPNTLCASFRKASPTTLPLFPHPFPLIVRNHLTIRRSIVCVTSASLNKFEMRTPVIVMRAIILIKSERTAI
jgi:hypothetical protein